MLPNVTAASAVRNVCITAAGRVLGHICGFRRHASNYSQMFRKRLNAEQVGRKFEVSDDELKHVARRMSDTMDLGLRRSGRPAGGSASIKCWNTRVPFPTPSTATEAVARQFLSVELSHGHRFSTRLTTLLGANDVSIKSREHPLTASALITGRVADLFDCVAGALAEFAQEFGVRQAGLPVAFTFGFPVGSTGPLGGSANLHRWTKEFDFVDGVSRDVAAEWRMAAARADVSVASVAVLNDACAAMMHSVAEKPDTRASVVVDDGCNCCYVSEFGRTVINTEWGAFGEDGALDHLLTEYDRQLDARSRNPGQQIYEKMTSGMYMAELVREMVLAMASNRALFEGVTTKAMTTEYALKAKHLWLVESDERLSYSRTRTVLTDVLDVTNPSHMDCELFRYACGCVTTRSANLVAAGLSSVLKRTGLPVTVAVSGSAFETHSTYALAVGHKARQLTLQQKPFTLRTVEPNVKSAWIFASLLATIAANPS